MKRLDEKKIPPGSREIRLFSAMRNESVLLPFWLDHYRSLGIDRFFIVDNDSHDGTREALLSEPDVHLFHTTQSFSDSDSGRLWFDQLMSRFGRGGWCVVADGDEFLAPPHWEEAGLRDVVDFLEAEGSEALPCYLLDMYSSDPIRDTVLSEKRGPFQVCPFFDPFFRPLAGVFHDGDTLHPIPTVVGSTREKVFGLHAYLSKISLLRYRSGIRLTSGQHGVLGASVSEIRGVMFHFKFLAAFVDKASIELERGERLRYDHEWDAYSKALERNPGLTLYDSSSVRLQDSKQLLELGIMHTTPAYELAVGKGSASWQRPT